MNYYLRHMSKEDLEQLTTIHSGAVIATANPALFQLCLVYVDTFAGKVILTGDGQRLIKMLKQKGNDK